VSRKHGSSPYRLQPIMASLSAAVIAPELVKACNSSDTPIPVEKGSGIV